MPTKPLHLCSKAGCYNLTRNRYCDEHLIEKNRYNKERTDTKYVKFYKTKEWQRIRMLAMKREAYLCVKCREQNIITKASMVHHIVPVKKDWDKRLTLSNLMPLCESCHNKIEH